MIIGVIGLGTVGFGTVDILTKEKERLEKTIGEEVVVKYGCALEDVNLPDGIIYTQDYHEVINDEDVDVVVELIGGTTIAKKIILDALNKKKHAAMNANSTIAPLIDGNKKQAIVMSTRYEQDTILLYTRINE